MLIVLYTEAQHTPSQEKTMVWPSFVRKLVKLAGLLKTKIYHKYCSFYKFPKISIFELDRSCFPSFR
jgi:hypothetical protein